MNSRGHRGCFRAWLTGLNFIGENAFSFGSAPRPAPRWRADHTCVTGWLRRKVPHGTFQARCLGRVQGWDPDLGVLVIDPLASFQ